ncbi:MAG: hypothetical protein AAGF85_14980 [Bacteroidota bacterium]
MEPSRRNFVKQSTIVVGSVGQSMPIWKCLGVSRNSYYTWRRQKRLEGNTNSRKDMFTKRIKEIYDSNKDIYGSPRIAAKLINKGISITSSIDEGNGAQEHPC